VGLIKKVLGPNGEVGRLVGSIRHKEKILDTPLVMNTPRFMKQLEACMVM